MESVKVVPNIIRALQGTIPKRIEEYLRNINAGIENSVSGISKVVCSRRSDRGDTTKRCEKKKKKTPRGWVRAECEGTRSPLSPSLLFFFLALFLRAALHYPNAWNRISAKILRGSLEAACCDMMMGLKFQALTHLPFEACTIAIMIKIIMIIILKY